jgi:hypothetical protein
VRIPRHSRMIGCLGSLGSARGARAFRAPVVMVEARVDAAGPVARRELLEIIRLTRQSARGRCCLSLGPLKVPQCPSMNGVIQDDPDIVLNLYIRKIFEKYWTTGALT